MSPAGMPAVCGRGGSHWRPSKSGYDALGWPSPEEAASPAPSARRALGLQPSTERGRQDGVAKPRSRHRRKVSRCCCLIPDWWLGGRYRGSRQEIARHPTWWCRVLTLAIRCGNQRGATGKTATHGQDEKASSGPLPRTGKTAWTPQIALSRRKHGFESRWGCVLLYLVRGLNLLRDADVHTGRARFVNYAPAHLPAPPQRCPGGEESPRPSSARAAAMASSRFRGAWIRAAYALWWQGGERDRGDRAGRWQILVGND